MTQSHHARGGAAIAVLEQLEAWEAGLILNLRLWCDGPSGQMRVWDEYQKSLPEPIAKQECRTFETLLRTLTAASHRPLVRHGVHCSCVGADECVFVHLVKNASDGHLNDAALMATLITGPARAEYIAVLAGQVGECMRRMHHSKPEFQSAATRNVARLH